jgi:hypothetical protein
MLGWSGAKIFGSPLEVAGGPKKVRAAKSWREI